MIYDGVIVKPPIEQLLIHSGIKGNEVIKGNLDNDKDRKDLLSEDYQKLKKK